MIELRYRDRENWVIVKDVEIDNIEIDWTNYSHKFKDVRIEPNFIQPDVISDTWNGKEHTVQQVVHEGHATEIYIKESEINDINRLAACSDIQILEYNRDSNGYIISKSYLADTTKAEWFEVGEPERISNTSSWKVRLVFRTNRIVVNKTNSKNRTNNVQISTTNFEFISSSDAEDGNNVIEGLTPTRLVNYNAGIIQMYELGSLGWVKLGNSFDTGYTTESVNIARLENDVIALVADTVDELSTFTFNGTDWVQTGNTLTLANSITSAKITKIDTYTIALVDLEYKYLETYEFDGLDWTLIGTPLSLGAASPTTLDVIGFDANKVAYINDSDSTLITYTWNGSTWSNSYSLLISVGEYLYLAKISATEIALLDADNSLLRSYVTSGSAWSANLVTSVTSGYEDLTDLTTGELVLALYDFSKRFTKISQKLFVEYPISIAYITTNLIAVLYYGSTNLVYVKAYTYDSTLNVWTATGNAFNTGYTSNGALPAKITKLATNTLVILFADYNSPVPISKYESVLMTLSWDGTDFAKVGNEYTSMYIEGEVSVCKLSSTSIVATSQDTAANAYYHVLTWDGTDWTSIYNVSTGQPTGALIKLSPLNGTRFLKLDRFSKKLSEMQWTGAVISELAGTVIDIGFYYDLCSLGDNTAQVVNMSNLAIENYEQPGTGLDFELINSTELQAEGGEVSVDILTTGQVVFANTYDIYIYKLSESYLNKLNNYTSGSFNYYTDFDVVNHNEQVEPIKIDWFDGSVKIARTINKSGYRALLYLSPEDYDLFISRYKEYGGVLINGTSITEETFENTDIAENLVRLEVKGIYDVSVYNRNLAPNSTYTLSMNSGAITYTTDYYVYSKARDVAPLNVEFPDGSIKTMQETKAYAYEFIYFTTDPVTYINNIKTYSDVTYNASVLTDILINQEEIAPGLWKITLNGIYSKTITTKYTAPGSGTYLSINDGSSTYTYYTDYAIEQIDDTPVIVPVENQTGVNTPVSTITKIVYRIKFFRNEADAFAIKKRFEAGGTISLNGTSVKEIRPVAPNKIGVGFYEIDVNCLTDTYKL